MRVRVSPSAPNKVALMPLKQRCWGVFCFILKFALKLNNCFTLYAKMIKKFIQKFIQNYSLNNEYKLLYKSNSLLCINL